MGWGAVIGAGIQAVASHINTALNWAASKDVASDNYDYSKGLASYQNQMSLNNLKVAPSYQMEGLKKAGINPISAYGNLANIQTQVPVFTGARAPEMDSGLQHIGKMLMELEKYRSDLESAKKQREVADSEINLNKANEELASARKVREENQTPTQTQDAELREASLRKILAETWSQTFGAYAGLKSSVHIKSSKLAGMLGVDLGATVFLGDIMALNVAGLYKADEVRNALRENAIQNGVKDPVKQAREAEKKPQVQEVAKEVAAETPSKPEPPRENSAKAISPGGSYFEEYLQRLKRRKEYDNNRIWRDPGHRVRRYNSSWKDFN